MIIHLATDHAGYELKQEIMQYLIDHDYEVVDHGAFDYDESDDYPDFVKKAANRVSEDPEGARAVVFGGSGQGEDMVADKFPHVRSMVYYGGPLEIVKLGREHNDANVLSIGARFVELNEAKKAVEVFLHTDFSGEERHERRIEKID